MSPYYFKEIRFVNGRLFVIIADANDDDFRLKVEIEPVQLINHNHIFEAEPDE